MAHDCVVQHDARRASGYSHLQESVIAVLTTFWRRLFPVTDPSEHPEIKALLERQERLRQLLIEIEAEQKIVRARDAS